MLQIRWFKTWNFKWQFLKKHFGKVIFWICSKYIIIVLYSIIAVYCNNWQIIWQCVLIAIFYILQFMLCFQMHQLKRHSLLVSFKITIYNRTIF